MSGVTFLTGNYLTEHPDVNAFFTSLKGQPRDQIRDQVQTYLDATRGFGTTFRRIREPSVEFRDRCGVRRPPDRFGGAVCGARPFGRRRQCGWSCLCANRARRMKVSALLGGSTLYPRFAAGRSPGRSG